jgi:RNA polymerase sigma-70 factor (ECF subfamily)
MQTPSDEELMLNVRGGDLAALEQLVRRNQIWAWRITYRFLGNEEDAEDVVQDAFIRLMDAASHYQPSARFRTYLYQIISRLCLDRAKKKQPFYVTEIPETSDPSPDAGEVMVHNETAAAVRVALDALPPRQRMAVILKYYEGLSYADIAKAMGITVKAVERLLDRARKALHASLAHIKSD